MKAFVIWVMALCCLGVAAMPAVLLAADADRNLPSYYIYEGSPLELELDFDRLAVRFASATKPDRYSASLSTVGLEVVDRRATGVDGWNLVTPSESFIDASDVYNRLQSVLASSDIEFASPVFTQPNGGWMIVTPDILVRLRPEFRKDAPAILEDLDLMTDIVEDNFGDMAGAFKLHSHSRNGFEVLSLANKLAADSRIEWAEPDMIATALRHMTPNDPGWTLLWGLNNTGQSGGTIDMDMDCDLAWDVTVGNPAVLVLVLDDGTELTHPDINIAGGADFTGQGSGGGPANMCDNHGTAVGGCVSAIVNNSLGTIGSAPGCRVLAAKFTISNVPCDGSGTFQFSWLVNALAWGLGQGARVSNNSNGLSPSSSVSAKYQDTYAAGMVHFASAGNDGVGTIGYPGSLIVVNAIGAINRLGNRASFSNYGPDLSLTAPGQSIYTTDRSSIDGYTSGNYATVDGTSFSSPYAAGVAALLLSVDPDLSASEVEDQLHTTAKDLGATGFDNTYGYGLVSAHNAVAFAQINITADITMGPAPITVSFTGSSVSPATSWSWTFGDGGTSQEQNPIHEYSTPGYYTVQATIESLGRFYTKTAEGLISAYADTIGFSDSRFVSTVGRVDVYVRNYLPLSQMEIPFVYSGPLNIFFDSVSVADSRGFFMNASVVSRVDNNKTASVLISAPTGQYLEPGEGPIASLWFHRNTGVVGVNTVQVADYPRHLLTFVAKAGEYVPVSSPGSLSASCCIGIVGDANGDGSYEPTIGDISIIIAHLFLDGTALPCYPEADANQSGGLDAGPEDITIGDISTLIDHLFLSQAPLPSCL